MVTVQHLLSQEIKCKGRVIWFQVSGNYILRRADLNGFGDLKSIWLDTIDLENDVKQETMVSRTQPDQRNLSLDVV